MDRTDEIFSHWSRPLNDLGFYLFIYFYKVVFTLVSPALYGSSRLIMDLREARKWFPW